MPCWRGPMTRPPTISAEAIDDLRNRARLLNARAQILRRTVLIDSDAQARMKAAFNRLTRQ